MEREPLRVVREARTSLTVWLDAVRKLSDPAAQPRGTVKRLSALLQSVSVALQDASPALTASSEWKQETALYAEALRELRARLSNFEIALRIRQNQMRGTQANLRVARSWSDLAKHIG
jgi:hypothetical protein